MMSHFNIPDSFLRAATPSVIKMFLLNSGFEISGKKMEI